MERGEYCCQRLDYHLNQVCAFHKDDPYTCPDSVIVKTGKGFGLPIHDGGSSFIEIKFCPWCGSRFKQDWRCTFGFREVPRLNMTRRAKEEHLETIRKEVELIEADKSIPDFEHPLDEEELLLLSWYLGWLYGIEGNLGSQIYWNSKAKKYGLDESNSPRDNLEKVHAWRAANQPEMDRYDSVKQVLVVRKDLNMRKGKMISQAAHASMLALLQTRENGKPLEGTLARDSTIHLDEEAYLWLEGHYTKIAVGVDSETELLGLLAHARTLGLRCALVKDRGQTELVPNTITALAIGPGLSEKVDLVTGHLKLL